MRRTGTKGISIGPNVRRLRELRQLSQAELARRAGMDQGHLSRIEDGTYKSPRLSNITKLARALNCELSDVTGDGEISRQLTPYERNAQYRGLIDILDDPRMREEDRQLIFALVQRLAIRFLGEPADRHDATPSPSVELPLGGVLIGVRSTSSDSSLDENLNDRSDMGDRRSRSRRTK
jgi:transcriptional regulator with XRE-family HTH domain